MQRTSITPEQFMLQPHAQWASRWLLLASGDFQRHDWNCMTVGWGSFGTMWGAPMAQVVVRPSRHTYRFMERYATFTLCGFPTQYRDALQLLGSRSGRDGDKVRAAGLTPISATTVAAPAFSQADLVIECQKQYAQDMRPECMRDAALNTHYPDGDYHQIYMGKIVAIAADSAYDATAVS